MMASTAANVTAPPSTGKKKKAQRVFGDVVIDEDNSLTYSPSPMREMSQSLATVFEGTDDSLSRSSKSSACTVEQMISDTSEKENKASPFPQMFNVKDPFRNQIRSTILKERRSPLRQDLVKRTQEAINKASESVRKTLLPESSLEKKSSSNKCLVAARLAKQALLREKVRETAKYQREWKADMKDAKNFYVEVDKFRFDALGLERQLSQKVTKQKVVRFEENKRSNLQKIEEESQFNSSVFRDHQKKLKELKELRRRMSTQAKAKMRENHMTGKEILRMRQLEEENAIHEERYATSRAIREKTSKDALDRRKSFTFRTIHAKKIKEIFNELDARRKEDEHQSFELKRAGDKDAEAYIRSVEEQKRKSLAKRNEYARQQRIHEQDDRAKKMEEEHLSFELKRDASKDAEAYLRKLEFDRRTSFAKRGQESHRINMQQHEEKFKELEIERASYELKRAAEKDVDEYKRRLEKERRDSFAFRNKERARHAKVMAEIEGLAREKEAESFILKWAGENDAIKYQEKLEDERRKSLQLRGQQKRHAREVEDNLRQQMLEQQRIDEDLRAKDHKDMEAYRKEQAERDRRSLEYRRKEARLQRLLSENLSLETSNEEAQAFQLDTQAWCDVQDYVKECKGRRRLSLAFRAKEKRRHAQWQNEREEKNREEESRLVRCRLVDQRYVELARQKERAQKALEAIKHAGRILPG